MKKLLFLVLALASCTSEIPKKEKKQFPEPSGVVNDYSDIFKEEEEKILTEIIDQYKAKTSNETAVVSIDNYEPYTNLVEYNKDLFNEWGIGQKEKNNGLLITIVPTSKQIRITTGTGTGKFLTDSICKIILDSVFVKSMNEDKGYFNSTKATLSACFNNWN
jgi:uncharacterized protein